MQVEPGTEPSIPQLQSTFKEYLPPEVVEDLVKASQASKPPKRGLYKRVLTPFVVVWCFILQRLNDDHTCDAVLSWIHSGALDGLDDGSGVPLSERMKAQNTGSYCRARKRMPLAVLQGGTRYLAEVAESRLGDEDLWKGHRVALLDGSTVTLRPHPDLVKAYGQAENQYGSAYWVVTRLVVAFGLYTASLLDLVNGAFRESEQSLIKSVLASLVPGTVGVGDDNFGVFSVAQAMRHNGIFCLLRLTAARAKSIAKHTMHSGKDIDIEWTPTRRDQCDEAMSKTPISGRLIYVQVQRDGFRPVDLYLFTTLLDKGTYPVADLVELYSRRWSVELDLRYVKSALKMDMLTCQTAQMAQKELWAAVAAYNVVRLAMIAAAQVAKVSPLKLRFTSCWRRVRDTIISLRAADTPERVRKLLDRLVEILGQCQLQKRLQFRVEPRATRHRRQTYSPLKGSRQEAREILLKPLLLEPAK